MGKNPSHFKGEKNPVERVSWNDAADFCRKLTDKVGQASSPAQTFRLPTEAEWEYACRAGTRTPFFFGETISTDQANYAGNYTYGSGRKGEYRQKAIPVGSFQPNEWGLYDMHGNVWEWCADWYGAKYSGESDRKNPKGPSDGRRVLRGVAWNSVPFECRSADHNWAAPPLTLTIGGFRVVCAGSSSR
jgi:formylglycine-generating enzyme required for sulfatase activity